MESSSNLILPGLLQLQALDGNLVPIFRANMGLYLATIVLWVLGVIRVAPPDAYSSHQCHCVYVRLGGWRVPRYSVGWLAKPHANRRCRCRARSCHLECCLSEEI